MNGHDLLMRAGALVAQLEAPEGADADISYEIDAWLAGCEDRMTAYWAVCKRLDAEGAQLRELETTLAKRRRYLERQADLVRSRASYMLEAREGLGEEAKVKTPLYSAWLATTTSVEVSVEPERLDACYRRIEVSIDKQRLKRDLELGAEIHGATLVHKRGVRWR
jgi:hypothetical protein